MNCIFCEQPEVKERIIVKNDLAFAFLAQQRIVDAHTLICPIRHVEKIEDLTCEELDAVLELQRKLKKTYIDLYQIEGFNYAWNEGETAGQTVPHIHFHMVPRKEGDSGIYEYEPRKFLYRPGSRNKTPQDELLDMTHEIKSVL